MTPQERALLSILHRRQQQRRHRSPAGCWVILLSGGSLLSFLLLVPLLGLVVATASAFIGYNMLASELSADLETLKAVDQRDLFQTTRITDRNGVVLYEIFDEGRRTPVPLERIPKYLRDATIATEDDTFYTNPGFDVLSVARAAYQNLTTGSIYSGASTITQQLVRHVAFSYEERISQSYERKIKEIMLAWILTQTHSKDQILEMYLNEIYYGNLAYGVQAASKTIFLNERGEPADVSELGLAESALLAGLPQSPAELDPLSKDPKIQARVKARQRQVLDLMVKHGYLSQAEADAAAAQPLRFNYRDEKADKDSFKAPHFVVYARQELEKLLAERRLDPKLISRGGLTVRTSLDLRLQDLAQAVARNHIEKLKAQRATNAALVALRPDTGEIMAMLGSVDYWNDAIDGRVNVAIRERQPGSSIKPITYAAAFENGFTPATILWDVPMTVPLSTGAIYIPKNYDNKFHGPVRLRTALANSYNIPAVKLLQRVGIEKMIETAHRMGITGLNRGLEWYGLSITLGGGEVTLLDLATAYATLANGGNLVRPVAILEVTNPEGQTLYKYPGPEPKPVLDPRAAYLVTSILSDNNARTPAFGPNSPLKLSQPAAVKTGTTDNFKDNWTVGYTPYMVVGVWVGNSNNKEMIRSSGVTGAAPIWHDFMEGVFKDPALLAPFRRADGSLPQTFVQPPDIETAQICRVETLRGAGPDCTETTQEVFFKGTAPREGDPELQKLPAIPITEPAADTGGEGGTERPVRWCLVDSSLALTSDSVQEVLFLMPPIDEQEMEQAYKWAEQHGVPIVPKDICQPDVLAAAHLQAGDQQPSANYRIDSPTPGAVLSGVTPILGTATFDPAEISYYKVEWGAGDTPSEWTTMGTTHDTPVVNGVLETFHADAVPPGTYILRLILVKKDTNFLPPYAVKVHVEH